MKYYDLNLKGQNYNHDKELVIEAYRLGWDYFNLLYSPEKYEQAIEYKDDLIEDIIQSISNDKSEKKRVVFNKTPQNKESFQKEIGIGFGIELKPKNQNELQKFSRKFRNKTEFISVLGGDLGINRAACENRKIDLLSRPYFKQRTCGINHVLAKEAVRNDVAIELCFNDILSSYLSYRAKIMAHFREIIKLHQKFKFPLVITTGSLSIWDIRSGRDILAIFKSWGLSENEINRCFHDYPKNIIEFNTQRENIVVSGVKKIKVEKL